MHDEPEPDFWGRAIGGDHVVNLAALSTIADERDRTNAGRVVEGAWSLHLPERRACEFNVFAERDDDPLERRLRVNVFFSKGTPFTGSAFRNLIGGPAFVEEWQLYVQAERPCLSVVLVPTDVLDRRQRAADGGPPKRSRRDD